MSTGIAFRVTDFVGFVLIVQLKRPGQYWCSCIAESL